MTDRERRLEWQPIETAPQDLDALFWIVAKTSEEAGMDMSPGLLFVDAPALFMGRFQSWSSLTKATHWMPLPDPPKDTP